MTRCKSLLIGLVLAAATGTVIAAPQQYQIDPKHTFVTFEISHIGFAWMPGTFNDFEGSLQYDPEDPGNSSVEFTVDVASIDTEHAERDKHLRGEDFFEVSSYPTARFVSTEYEPTGEGTARLKGELTIKDVTRPVTFEVRELAAGEDPWGNFRRAFSATATLRLKDFNIDYELGPEAETAQLRIALEATRQ